MSYLEQDLKNALRRQEPREDFTAGVLARLDQPAPPESSWWELLGILLRPPRVQWVALSVIFSVILPLGAVQYRREQRMRAEGERAKAELVFAVRVAGAKLHKVQQRVLEIGRTDTRI